MEAGPRDVTFVVIGRHDSSPLLDHRAVAHRSVADVVPWLDREIGRRQTSGLTVQEREHLAAPCVDHRHRPGRPGGERLERRHARDRKVEGKPEPTRSGEPDSHAGEAPGPHADGQ